MLVSVWGLKCRLILRTQKRRQAGEGQKINFNNSPDKKLNKDDADAGRLKKETQMKKEQSGNKKRGSGREQREERSIYTEESND